MRFGDYRDYGREYKVFITFNTKELKQDEIDEIIKKHFVECDTLKILSKDNEKLELYWKVPVNEGIHEIEIPMYYILEDGKYGKYKCEYLS